jgi:hypothetical protein
MNVQSNGHEHEFEPEYGLPEPLPVGERILWQGSPDWRMLARRAFHVRKLVVYFAVILAIRSATVWSSGGSATDAILAALWLAPLAGAAVGMAAFMAWLSARTTVYTITDKRIVMRVGIVLSLTFNLPFSRLANAALRLDAKHGTGDIPLVLAGSDRIAYLHLWPHARPWRVAKPEPMLRSVPDAARVAEILAEAWKRATGAETRPAAVSQPAAEPRAGEQPARARGVQPAMAAH